MRASESKNSILELWRPLVKEEAPVRGAHGAFYKAKDWTLVINEPEAAKVREIF